MIEAVRRAVGERIYGSNTNDHDERKQNSVFYGRRAVFLPEEAT